MMLVIYDENGFIYFSGTESKQPTVLQSLNTEVPEDKYLDSIDVNTTPHQPIFKDVPKTDMELIYEKNQQQQADIDYLMLLLE